ncbi:hypothetical protein QQ008_08990 [Fulvivirgaceae bacterium BMA10]|uniref:Uncharacterized protein n=1 Tax=Splendidivirga corallicola TaxID=3051826 RepID=A0ABT8KL96_9BACT|nr:hypothetical protein [Fulvivirgaceae bacterium BMA10]
MAFANVIIVTLTGLLCLLLYFFIRETANHPARIPKLKPDINSENQYPNLKIFDVKLKNLRSVIVFLDSIKPPKESSVSIVGENLDNGITYTFIISKSNAYRREEFLNYFYPIRSRKIVDRMVKIYSFNFDWKEPIYIFHRFDSYVLGYKGLFSQYISMSREDSKILLEIALKGIDKMIVDEELEEEYTYVKTLLEEKTLEETINSLVKTTRNEIELLNKRNTELDLKDIHLDF